MRVSQKTILLFLIGMISFFSGCSTVPYQSASGRESLSGLCRQTNLSFTYDPVTRSAQIRHQNRRVYVLVGSDVVSIDGDKVLLNTPVGFQDGEVMVPPDFRSKVLCSFDSEFCAGRLSRQRSGFRIVLDPGHGGKDTGAIGVYKIKEKDIVLDISRRLEALLDRKGFDVRVTRHSDEFLTLEKRTESTASWNADLFVSIHANASQDRRASGFEIWAPRALDYHDLSEMTRKNNHKIFSRHLNMQQNNAYLNQVVEDLMYQHKYAESLNLASVISKKTAGRISSKNRGVKQSGFFVLRNTLVPSVLVEVGFISNHKEARQLQKPSYRQEIAETLAEGIQEYIRGL